MHLVIPFAAPLSEPGRAALGALSLPTLEALLARLDPAERDEGDEYQLSPPHERALARAWGWHGADGRLPFAARAAEADGIEPLDFAWGLMSPVHWQVGAEHLRMGDPDALGLDAAESRAFFDAVRPLFESEGYACAWGAPTRWYVAHASLADLPTASLDRVIGRNPDLWMPEPAAARPGSDSGAANGMTRCMRRLSGPSRARRRGGAQASGATSCLAISSSARTSAE